MQLVAIPTKWPPARGTLLRGKRLRILSGIRRRFHTASTGILTVFWQDDAMRRALFPLLCLMLAAACADAGEQRVSDSAIWDADPVVARALNDPLMNDPDLASRNEANAAIGFIDSDALPAFPADTASALAAREAGRLELLEGGSIPDLPLPDAALGGRKLGAMAIAADLIHALGAPARCADRITEDFTFAASLPPVAAIMPHGMVVQAGGADTGECRIRIIRYQTAATPEDVLAYHYARAVRGGLKATRHARPEDMIAASSARSGALVVHVRTLASGLSGVDLLYRAF